MELEFFINDLEIGFSQINTFIMERKKIFRNLLRNKIQSVFLWIKVDWTCLFCGLIDILVFPTLKWVFLNVTLAGSLQNSLPFLMSQMEFSISKKSIFMAKSFWEIGVNGIEDQETHTNYHNHFKSKEIGTGKCLQLNFRKWRTLLYLNRKKVSFLKFPLANLSMCKENRKFSL